MMFIRTSCLILLSGLLAFLPPGSAGQPESRSRTMKPVIRGRHHAVTSMKPESTLAAERILREGGNAFDAVVAGQAVLGLVDAAGNGIGSDAVLLVYDSKAGKVWSINAEGTAPRLATIEWFRKNHGGKLPLNEGLLVATVPGVIDAWFLLLDRWGTMSFEQVLAPAIEMAENGFPLGDRLARSIAGSEKLQKFPTSRALYFPGGAAPAPGAMFRNPGAAKLMKMLVAAEQERRSEGRRAALRAARDRFYRGDVARTLAEFSERNGGLLRYEDFEGYSAKVEEPVSAEFRSCRVYKNPSSTQGPTELFALNILEGYDLEGLGHNSGEYIHTCAEAMKLAFADREKYLGDADFIQIPYEALLSKQYARERMKLIDPKRASLELRPGSPERLIPGMEPITRPLDFTIAEKTDHWGDTSYIAVVDRERNMVTFTPSLHSGFGTGVVMADLGFILNCRGDYYSLVPGHANALEPGKRPRSTLQGTLVLKDGKPHMVMGSPGGDDQCMRTLQTLLNLVEFGMNIQQAIEAPRWSTRSFPASSFPHAMWPGDLTLEARIGAKAREILRRKGHKIRMEGSWVLGSNAGIVVDPQTGLLSAGADPRSDAYALAW